MFVSKCARKDKGGYQISVFISKSLTKNLKPAPPKGTITIQYFLITISNNVYLKSLSCAVFLYDLLYSLSVRTPRFRSSLMAWISRCLKTWIRPRETNWNKLKTKLIKKYYFKLIRGCMFLEKPTDKITANDKERVLGRFPQHLN